MRRAIRASTLPSTPSRWSGPVPTPVPACRTWTPCCSCWEWAVRR